jgi:TolB-like protein
MADVFISYATEDRERVKPIVEAIEDAGFSVWWDRRIGLGASFDREIERELDAARCVVVVWSAGSVESDWVRNEAQEGLDRGVLVPLVIDDVRPPLAFRRAQTAALSENPTDDELNLILPAVQSSIQDSHSDQTFNRSQESHRTRKETLRGSSWISLAGIAVAAILVVGGAWWYLGSTSDEIPIMPVTSESLTIAVMPFTNMSNDPEQEFFSDGIAEDILNELAKNRRLIVRPRASSFALKNADLDMVSLGERLNVTHVLEGSVRRSGSRIRVTAQLSDVAGNRSVWNDRYDRELTDVFAVQDTIVGEILGALDVQIGASGADRFVPGIKAYDAYLLARDYHIRGEYQQALRWSETATRLEPSYASAWFLRSQSMWWGIWAGVYSPSGVEAQRRRQFLEIAADLDPVDEAIRATLVADRFFADRDAQQAIDDTVSLIRENHNNPLAYNHLYYLLQVVDRIDLAPRLIEQMLAVRPGEMTPHRYEIETLVMTGELGRAQIVLQEYAARFEFPFPGVVVAIAMRDPGALQAVLDDAPPGWSAFHPFYLAAVPYLEGDYERAKRIIAPIKNTQEYQSHLFRSYSALIERDLDAAFDHYAAAITEPEPLALQYMHGRMLLINLFPEFYADPRHEQMLADAGFGAESLANILVPELPF